MACGGFPFFAGCVGVVDHSVGHSLFDQIHPLLGYTFEVEGHRQARGVEAVVPNGDSLAHDALSKVPGHEASPFLHSQRAEAQAGQHVHYVHYRVFLQYHGVATWW